MADGYLLVFHERNRIKSTTKVRKFQKTVNTMGSPSCLVHFKGEEGPLTCFSEVSFEKLKTSQQLWLSLDGQQREIAEKTTEILQEIVSMEDPSQAIEKLHYHRSCYSKFTNITLIRRAQARCNKHQGTNDQSEENEMGEKNIENTTITPPAKILRSSTSSALKSRSQHVLPPVCIICGQEKAYKTEPVSTSSI